MFVWVWWLGRGLVYAVRTCTLAHVQVVFALGYVACCHVHMHAQCSSPSKNSAQPLWKSFFTTIKRTLFLLFATWSFMPRPILRQITCACFICRTFRLYLDFKCLVLAVALLCTLLRMTADRRVSADGLEIDSDIHASADHLWVQSAHVQMGIPHTAAHCLYLDGHLLLFGAKLWFGKIVSSEDPQSIVEITQSIVEIWFLLNVTLTR